MPEDFDVRKRMPSVPKKVGAIAQNDVRVSILGTVIDVSGNNAIVDDGTGKLNVGFEGQPQIRAGQLVRVLGRVMPADGGVELQGELVQDMGSLDLTLRKKAESLGGA